MKRLKYWAAVLALMLVLLRPQASVDGARRAMELWAAAVAPALFPFLAMMPILTGADACAAYEAALGKIMRRLFRLPGAAAPAVIIGMISGSPGGALALRRIAARSGMRRCDAKRIALAVCGVSPAYLVLGVGYGLNGSLALGFRLVLIQLGTQLLLLCCLQGGKDTALLAMETENETAEGMRTAAMSMIVICGYMVFCGALANVAASLMGEGAGTALLLAADLPSGLAALQKWQIPGKLLIQCAAVGFGGLCIGAQNMDVLRELGVRWKDYLCARAAAAMQMGCCSIFAGRGSGIAAETAGLSGKTYAISMLAVGIISLPVLIFLSKNLFLNKRD